MAGGTPWIIIAVLALLTILAVAFLILYKYRKKPFKPDYYNMFYIGIVLVALGIIFNMTIFWMLGLIYMGVAGAHKKDWEKNRKTWKKMDSFEKKLFAGLILGLLIFFLLGIGFYLIANNSSEITNFEECMAAGNPAMESYPRQCRDPLSGQTFVEVIEDNSILTGSIIAEEEPPTID